MSRSGFHRPTDRKEYQIAIICALPVESDAVMGVFDEDWEKDQKYPRKGRDTNSYAYGRIGVHNVVLAFMSRMGKGKSAALAAHALHSFPEIKLCLVVGICGGVPFYRETIHEPREKEILIGDIIISTGIVQYDFGRQYSDAFVIKNRLLDNLSRPNDEVGGFLHKMTGLVGRERLEDKTTTHLAELLQRKGFEKSRYQGADKDILYDRNYRHKHRDPADCICAKCEKDEDSVCNTALDASCEALHCSPEMQVGRSRLEKLKGIGDSQSSSNENGVSSPSPLFHFGFVASGDSVMQSAYHRDNLADQEGVIGFEMEGAGPWDRFPTVVIKSVVDYSDSHKSYTWQKYGAACAAAGMKALLNEWGYTDETSLPTTGSSITEPVERQTDGFRSLTREELKAQKRLEQIRKKVDDAYFLIHCRNKETRKDDLEAALWILSRAEAGSRGLDSSLLQDIFWGLMAVEKTLSCYSHFDPTEKIEHIRKAQKYNTRVGNIVSRTSHASLRAQVSLEQQILEGRRAKLEFDRGRDVGKVTTRTLEAMKGIDTALLELQAVDPVTFKNVVKAALAWRDKFFITSIMRL